MYHTRKDLTLWNHGSHMEEYLINFVCRGPARAALVNYMYCVLVHTCRIQVHATTRMTHELGKEMIQTEPAGTFTL